MRSDVVEKLVCPNCGDTDLKLYPFVPVSENEVKEGVLVCVKCQSWYPIENYLLEFLPIELAYEKDRELFWNANSTKLQDLNLVKSRDSHSRNVEMQVIQQKHFDWYAENEKQAYEEYKESPFWTASDRLVFDSWHSEVEEGGTLLDVGCAQGRATFQFMDLDIQIIGIDISKNMIRQAIDKYRSGNYRAKATFFVGDASNLPFIADSFENVMLYGVLHHLPAPDQTCAQIAQVLKENGTYFGQENNKSVFRFIFDLLQKISPQWYEEAGEEPLVALQDIEKWFGNSPIDIVSYTSVFLPPHLLNVLSHKGAYRLLQATDRFFRALPGLKNNGGLIVFKCRKS